jgi:Flp pilus assembly protein TadG
MIQRLFPRSLTFCQMRQKNFSANTRGAVAVVFALIIIPILIAVGGAIDMSYAWFSKQNLQQLSDEIGTVTTSSAQTYLAKNGPSQLATATTNANTQLTNLCNTFKATNKQLSGVSCSMSLSLNGLILTNAISVSATYSTSFLGVVGLSQIPISETSSLQASLPPYVDFYMLLDNSPSMGIGATVQDMTTLASATGGCEFACHDTGEPSSNTYQTARNVGVTLRIDQVKSASQALLTYAGQQQYASRYRIAAYSFGVEAYPGVIGLTQVAALNSNFTTVQNNLSSLDLMWLPYNNTNNNDDSDIDGNLSALSAIIPTPGDGSSSSAAQKVIFLVSDGAADIAPPNPGRNRYWYSDGVYPGSSSNPCVTTYNDYDGNHCMQPVTVAVCNAIKAKGILIAALYTTYFKYSNSSEYPTYIAPIASAIPTNMKACATPGLYFEVNPQTSGISSAMQTLFQAAINQATRITK